MAEIIKGKGCGLESNLSVKNVHSSMCNMYLIFCCYVGLELVPGNTKPNTYNSLVLMFVDYSPDMWQSLAQKSKACVEVCCTKAVRATPYLIKNKPNLKYVALP